MKRLEIQLLGHSRALLRLAAELEEHGHSVTLSEVAAATPDLLIDDGSQPPASDCPAARLSLRWRATTQGLQLLCLASAPGAASRCVARGGTTASATGNGAEETREAVDTLLDLVLPVIGQYSRDSESLLREAPSASTPEDLRDLSELERHAFGHRLNETRCQALLEQAGGSFVERLSQSLLRHAERSALRHRGASVSYAALHAYSLAIQERLDSLLEGADTDSPPIIGISLEKGLALYAGILAVLGCGAVYLPLDPSHPRERRSAILKSAGARLLLHDGSPNTCIDELPGLDISRLEYLHHGVDGRTGTALAPCQQLLRRSRPAEAPCVAIYTSGTTGQPKGVLLGIGNLSHFCAWYAAHVEVDEDARVLQFSTISFDASMLDLFPTLIQGAELVVPDEDDRRDPQRLANLIGEQHVSHAFLPPALLSIMPLDTLKGMRHLVTGGDVCEPHVIDELAGYCALHNIYGPTETTVLATTRRFRAGDDNRNLGAPIANTRILILDEHDDPVLDGETGELYIVGPGVGLGYLNAPELTAERYRTLELPGGERCLAYRSGDLCRWQDDGIRIVGRRDNQIKIRGFRVEPEEIESTLRQAQLFRQVAVVIDERKRILAYLAQPLEADADSARERLREHARQRLPDYMQPGACVVLPRLPATANGKIDRNALRNLPPPQVEQARRLAPRTEEERRLLALWGELLELGESEISIDESFFNLGGHSILLSRMLLGLRQRFGRSVPINRFVESPTIQTLAHLLADGDGASGFDPQALRDAERPLQLDVLPLNRMGDVHKVVLTGANSFLGVHLVEALLDWGASEIACLVRAKDDEAARQRFIAALADNRLEGLDLERVRVYAADITQPRLGLSEAVYTDLDLRYGAMIHNAANVNHVLDYAALARDNVEPIFECLRFCEGRSKKILNFVSTLSASSSVDENGRVLERPPAHTPPIYIRNGYNLTKWVAERILWSASEQGVQVNLYRPGNITFNTRTGVCQPHRNRLMLMLKGSLQLRKVPELSLNFDLMPVDFLARFIAFHASRCHPARAVFNLHNPEPLSWEGYLEAFREIGHRFDMVPVPQWQQLLGQIDRDNALFEVLGFYLDGFEEDIGDISLIEYRNALSGILNMGERYPAKSSSLLRKGCEYLREIDFI
ncbi:amino acid adenylation domain-containing protein [Pseudomonas aeruginosa]|nr:non-ribosomal peptide synthetase [Pseudomonas aeruginosa]ELS0718222.1 non-ribosomal peptide synthetase [Pseudomonas aeruginosa]